MATTAEKQALGFLVLVALAGTAVRVTGASRFSGEALTAAPTGATATMGERALAAQIAAVDSARSAPRRSKSKRGPRTSESAHGARSSNAERPPRLSERKAPEAPELVDVNAAGGRELERLPRVGPALAQRIVAWREKHGPFANPEDLRHVRGIGPTTLRLITPLVTFSSRPRPFPSEGPPFEPPFP